MTAETHVLLGCRYRKVAWSQPVAQQVVKCESASPRMNQVNQVKQAVIGYSIYILYTTSSSQVLSAYDYKSNGAI